MIQTDEEELNKIIEKLDIPESFFFYPAQFWPHKNHYRIVEAIGLLKKTRGIRIPIIFVGKASPEWEVLTKCRALAKRYGIEDQIRHFGYVKDKELVALYRRAAAMIMPTFFGPTNIPYLEAFYYKCPVIASDIPGIREQVGDAAVLVNPKDTDAISEAMHRIWKDGNLREDLIKKGEVRFKEFAPQRFKEKLHSIVKEFTCNTQR